MCSKNGNEFFSFFLLGCLWESECVCSLVDNVNGGLLEYRMSLLLRYIRTTCTRYLVLVPGVECHEAKKVTSKFSRKTTRTNKSNRREEKGWSYRTTGIYCYCYCYCRYQVLLLATRYENRGYVRNFFLIERQDRFWFPSQEGWNRNNNNNYNNNYYYNGAGLSLLYILLFSVEARVVLWWWWFLFFRGSIA